MRKIFYSLILCLFGLYLGGCSDDPTSLGKNFFTGQGLKLDSLILVGSKDTAVAESYYTPTPHNGVRYLLVGKSQTDNLEAWSLLNFTPTLVSYNDLIRNGSLPIDSAQLILNTLYKYGDTTQTMVVSGYVINNSWGYSTVTADSTINYDPSPVFTAGLNDTTTTIPLRSDVVLKWLQASLDTNPIGYSYGLLLKPANSVTHEILGVEALTSSSSYPPTLKLYIHRPGSGLDSASYYVSTNTHIVYPARHDSVSGLILQSGLASISLLRFNISSIPKNVIINSAYLSLTQDTINSKYGVVDGSNYNSAVYAYADSIGAATPRTPDYNYYGTFSGSNGVQTANVATVINRFYLLSTEARIVLRDSYYQDGVEKYIFYDPLNADRSKRPLLKIYYTKRANQ